MTATLPKAIQAELEAAEATQRQLSGETPETGDTAPAEAPPDAPSADLAPTAPVPSPTDSDLLQRHNTLIGKYNAEVPRLQQQLRDQQTQANWALEQLAALQREIQQPKDKPAPVVSEGDVEKYGDEMTGMVNRIATRVTEQVATQVFHRLFAEFRKEMAPVQQAVQEVRQTSQATEAELYFGKIKSLVPDWDTVDKDPRWVEFLNSRASGSMATHRDLAAQAISARQVDPVVELVRLWKQLAGESIEPNPTPAPVPASQAVDVRRELERQVAPSSQRTATAVTPQRVWTMDDYNRAFDPRNRHTMGDKQWNDLMAAADQALNEGRIKQ